jgi:methylenetetrahydrofolate dehydrogenase (NADP+)/methenyltetrahydrofolate cyclohydrolase
MAKIMDGARVRDDIKQELKPRIQRMPRAPGLAVILAGSDPASEIYVRNKVKTSLELGIHGESITPPTSVSTVELLGIVAELNARPEIDAILVQLPLPEQVDSKRVLLAVDPLKDVDGFHPTNLGNLVTGRPGPRPCTPAGILELLRRYRIPIAGRHAVIVGRSDIVGKPVAFLLLHEHATVTICHSRTRDLPSVCRQADILVAAIGHPAMITAEYLKPDAAVVDVGINRVTSRQEAERVFAGAPERLRAFLEKGSAIVGDVQPGDVARVAGAYTPVPGGVGPLTIAMLMANTVQLAELRLGIC